MTPSTTAAGVPESKMARTMSTLANHPPIGGMPASEKRKIVITTASPGA
jgi:hypothetical protein